MTFKEALHKEFIVHIYKIREEYIKIVVHGNNETYLKNWLKQFDHITSTFVLYEDDTNATYIKITTA